MPIDVALMTRSNPSSESRSKRSRGGLGTDSTTRRTSSCRARVDVAVSAEDAVVGVDGVINATPVGTYIRPGTPVDLTTIRDQQWLFDAIYSPIETALMARAADVSLMRISGFDLFLGQAIDAFEIFTGHCLAPTVLAALETRMRVVERGRRF
jgi:shikimate 5-dehydrogenase